jgi:WD40 repeat protein
MTPNADPAAPAQGAAAGDQISTGPIQGVGIAVGTGASVQIYGDIHYYPITLHAPLRERFAPLIADRIGLFAGRDPILNRIMHRIQDPAGGYTVLTAPAGFGKTALMAALIHRTPAAFAYHFFTTLYGEDGLSERFFLRNVVEQMARWHGREERVPTDLDELRALYHALRDAPRDHTRILILDGLDEVSAWDPAPYLSRPLGERLHMIVTIRDVGQDWLATYRFPPHQVFPLPLGGLDRDATIAVFQAAGPQSAALVADAAAVAAVLRVAAHADAPKLGADPFYVRLLAEDAAQGHVTAATIAAQPTGLNAYLDQWWEAIRRQAGDQPVRDLFGTLTAAAGPLTRADLEALNPSLVDAWDAEYFTTVLQSVRRFVAGNAAAGYTLAHPRLRAHLAHKIRTATYAAQLQAYCARWAEHGSHYALRAYARSLAADPPALHTLLLTFAWLQRKLAALGYTAVQDDFDLMPGDATLRSVHEALKRSAQVLQDDPNQLAGQLIGRLIDHPDPALRPLLSAAAAWREAPWLQPRHRSLAPPGDPLLFTLAGHAGTVRSLALTTDGRWALSAGNSHPDGTTRLWNLATGLSVLTLNDRAERGGYTLLGLTADGQFALIAQGNELVIWNTATGNLQTTLSGGHAAPISALAVADQAPLAVSADQEGALAVWDLSAWRLLRTGRHSEPISTLAVTPDGRYLAGVAPQTLFHWDMAGSAAPQTHPMEAPFAHNFILAPLALSADGRYVFAGSPAHSWDVATGAATALSYARAADRTVALAAVPSAQHERILALTAAESGSDPRGETLDLWDAQTGTHLQQVPPQGSAIATLALHGAADAGTTRLTLITAHYDHYLRVWALDRPGPSAVAAVARDAWAVEAAFAPDARRALIRVEGVAQSIWDTATAQAHAIGPADAPLVELLDRARGEQRDRVARAYALIEQRERPEPPPSEARAASGKPGRRLLVVGGAEARLFVAAATETHALTYLQDGAKGAETEESGPPDPRFALRYWDLTDPTAEPLELRGHSLRVYCSALSGAGLRAVSAGAGRVVRVWDLRTGAALWALPGHQGTVWGLAVTPDGRYALSASEDRTVRLWDLEHGAAVATYTGDLPFRRCALSADARHAVAIDVLGRAHLLQAIRPDA